MQVLQEQKPVEQLSRMRRSDDVQDERWKDY